MAATETNGDAAATLALQAVIWVLGTPARAERFVALTGIDVPTLRARANDPALLSAVIRHLEAHEVDLVACADDLDVSPAALVAARSQLES